MRKGETSYKETSFGIIPRSQLIPLEIEGIKKAWDFVLVKYKNGKIPITPVFIKKVHNIGFGWIFPDMGGKFRREEVTVSKHTPPKYYKIPQLMDDFCKDIKARVKHLPKIEDEEYLEGLINLLAWVHHRFLWIHPFKDYNGRIGRLLINIILLDLELPPIELKVETDLGREKYVKALQCADSGDYASLENIIKVALEESTKDL